MNIKISIAGYTIEIALLYKNTRLFFKDYIMPQNQLHADITIELGFDDLVAEQLITHQGSKLFNGIKEYSFFNLEKHEFYAIYRKVANIMPFFDTFLMHGSVVAINNTAYMFTAPSGVGKTTRSMLWLEEYKNSFIVNGDKPLIRVTESQILACGTPWCGKEGLNTNIIVPLKAIFLLERTDKSEENSIKQISFSEALPYLVRQTFIPNNHEAVLKTIHLLKQLNGKVKIYQFRSAPTKEAIQLAYKTVNGEYDSLPEKY